MPRCANSLTLFSQVVDTPGSRDSRDSVLPVLPRFEVEERRLKSRPNFLGGSESSAGWAKAVTSDTRPEKMQETSGTMINFRSNTTVNDSIHFHSSASPRFARKAVITSTWRQERPIATTQNWISHQSRLRSCLRRWALSRCSKSLQAKWNNKLRGMKFNLVGGIPIPLKNMKVSWEGLSHIWNGK